MLQVPQLRRWLAAFACVAFPTASSPCAREYVLSTQAEVERLAELRCEELGGSLRVTGDVQTLRPLRGLRRVSGKVSVRSAMQLVTFEGLEDLTSISDVSEGGNIWSLMVTDNPKLESFAELRNVTELRFGLYVEANPMLQSFEGLNGLRTVCPPDTCGGYAFIIKNNAALTSLAALSNVTGSIAGMIIESNPELKTLKGLENITGITVGLLIGNHDALVSLAALRSMSTIGESISMNIHTHPQLESLDGLQSMTDLTELIVNRNSRLKNLTELRGIHGHLNKIHIAENTHLVDLKGLEGVTSADNLVIQDNAALKTLAALSNMQKIDLLTIDFNSALRSLSGLEGISLMNTRKSNGCNTDNPGEYVVIIRRNVALQSIEALGNIMDTVNCPKAIELNPNLASLQIFANVTFRSFWTLEPAPRCFPREERDNLFRRRSGGTPTSLPSVTWDESECKRCAEPCGTIHGVSVPCDYSSGRCRCPSGTGGTDCAQMLPMVTVPLQRYACPFFSTQCKIRVQLLMQGASHRNAKPEAFSLYGPTDALPQEGSVSWRNLTHGEVSFDIVQKGELTADVYRVGYSPNSQPDCLLNGTLVDGMALFVLFPWCVDSGDCTQVAPGLLHVEVCKIGEVVAHGAGTCTGCGRWRKSSANFDKCIIDAEKVFMSVTSFAVYVFAFGLFLSQLSLSRLRLSVWAGRHLELHDVWSYGGMTVVATTEKHHLKAWGTTFAVLFEGTGNPELDGVGKRYRARTVNPSELELLDKDGKPLGSGNFDTSQGTLRLTPWRTLWHTGWPLPLAVQVPCITFAASWLHAASPSENWVVSVAMILSLAVSACRTSRRRVSQLKKRLDAYALKVREVCPTPSVCKPGPDRAIRAGIVVNLLDYFETFIRDRSMYYVVSNIVMPLTKDEQVSLAELVGPSSVEWFVSHFWGSSFRDFCASIRKHAECANMSLPSWENASYWICSFSNNQHKIEEEIGTAGDCSDSSFCMALMSQSCQGTCMVIDPSARPLTRSWCLFELLKTIQRDEDQQVSSFKGLFFCTSSGVINHGRASIETSLAIGRSLGALDLERAEASVQKDKDTIQDLVKKEMGSFSAINSKLKQRVAETLRTAKVSAAVEFEKLEVELTAQSTQTPVP